MNVFWRNTELIPVMSSDDDLALILCTYLFVLKCIFIVRAAVSPPSSRLSSDVVDSSDSRFSSQFNS